MGVNALNDAWVLTNADGTESTSPTWTKLLPANPLQRVPPRGRLRFLEQQDGCFRRGQCWPVI